MSGGERIQVVSEETFAVLEELKLGGKSDSEKLDIIRNHIKSAYSLDSDGKLKHGKNMMSLSFDSACEWINTVNPPNLDIVSSENILILEFFTHCCINCIHSIEDVHQAHDEITSTRSKLNKSSDKSCGLKIISVHSPKFPREKNADSIRDFVDRMQMSYTDVVNDPNCTLWNEWQIFCWPTILIFGPSRHQTTSNELNLIFTLMGEGHGKTIKYLVSNALEVFDEMMDFTHPPSLPPPDSIVSLSKVLNPAVASLAKPEFLKYPGKVAIYSDMIAIADSGNNRIILCDNYGNVQEIIGGLQRGYENGDFLKSRFYNPQGLVFKNSSELFVADTGNHSIRKIDLNSKTVETLVPPNFSTIGENDLEIHLKSPWDLTFYGDEVLLIASAGNHQIFGYFFEELQLFRALHLKNSFDLIAGSGKEENRNNIYPLKSGFAQPSGIAVSHGINENDKIIFIADAESSSIRYINSAGRVTPLVGGSKDPTDLFSFGDIDGCSYDVRLQHPMGVCAGVGATKMFIVDTYNHKVKMIDLETKHCTTLIGDGTVGNRTGGFSGYIVPKRRQSSSSNLKTEPQVPALLNEPNGICLNETLGLLFIADTNNHVVKIANLKTMLVSELQLKVDNVDSKTLAQAASTSSSLSKGNENVDQTYDMRFPSSFDSTFEIKLFIHNIPPSFEGGTWKALSRTTNKLIKSGALEKNELDSYGIVLLQELTRDVLSEISSLLVEIYLCGTSTCFRKAFRFSFNVNASPMETLDNESFTSPQFNFYTSDDAMKETLTSK